MTEELEIGRTGLSSFQALITGTIAGGLAKASGEFLLIDVEVKCDEEGNYTNEIIVRGQESGEQLIVTVERAR